MRYNYLSSFCLLMLTGLFSILSIGKADAQIKIGTNGATIAPSSLLELESASQGLLLPRMADTVAINALNPPSGMLIYLTKVPAVGLYVRKVTGWEFLTGSLGGNANFTSVTVSGAVTAGSFSGPLTGNATTSTTATTATNSINSAVTNDLSTTAVTYPTFVTTTPGNTGLRTSNANLSFVPGTGVLTARGFSGPLTGNVTGTATQAIDATNAANTAITNDITTNALHYPTFVSASTGNLAHRTSSPNFTFNPNTGTLSAISFNGNLNGNANSATNVTGVVALANGGTGAVTKAAAFDALSPMTTAGDIIYMSPGGTGTRLPVGAATTFLKGGLTPNWSTINLASGEVTGIVPSNKGGTGVSNAYTLTLGADVTLTSTGITNVTLPISTPSGSTLVAALSGSATLIYPIITNLQSNVQTITVNGAADGDPVSLGPPFGSVTNDFFYFAWVSGVNTVSVRCTNLNTTTPLTPPPGIFKVKVFK
ncbi:MAG: hypothetical protein ACYCZO_13000 [Daejeonella sp.]